MLLRTHRNSLRIWTAGFLAFGAMVCAAGMVGCKPVPPSKPASEFTPEEARGARVFQASCAECHYPDKMQGKRGPGLQALTKLKSMPSGAPPSDERIMQTILHGHGMMQPVPVPQEDLQPLLAYLHTL
jgi:mono/diheme cytochrome c family protein